MHGTRMEWKTERKVSSLKVLAEGKGVAARPGLKEAVGKLAG